MKAIINDIRSQPHHVRHLATVLCTVAVVAVVALVWFNAFQHDIYAMLNPADTTTQDSQVASTNQPQDQLFAQQSKSLFGSIVQLFSDTKAQISSFISGKGGQTDIVNQQATTQTNTSTDMHPLPVSGSK